MKIYRENPDLVKTGEKYRGLYMKTWVCTFIVLLTAVRIILWLSSTKGIHYCVFMTTY